MVDFPFQSNKKNLDKNPHEQAQHILEQAHKKAEHIVEHAVKKSEEILKQVNTLKDELEIQAQNATLKATNLYQEVLNEHAKDVRTNLQSLLPAMKEPLMQGIQNNISLISATIAQEMRNSLEITEKDLQTKIAQRWQEVDKELAVYKDEQMKTMKAELQKKVDAQVSYITEKVLGKALSKTEKEQLVFDALEQAEKQGLFK